MKYPAPYPGLDPDWWKDHEALFNHLCRCGAQPEIVGTTLSAFLEWSGIFFSMVGHLEKSVESPLERMFFAHMVELLLTNATAYGVVVLPPCADFPAFREKVLMEHRAAPTTYPPTLLNALSTPGNMLPSSRTFKAIWPRVCILSLQPAFPGVKVGTPLRSVRTDAVLWCLSGTRVVLECDSRQYHMDDEAFERDRQRSEALQTLGYRVLQFSGREIFNDPRGVAGRALDAFQALRASNPKADKRILAELRRLSPQGLTL